MDRNQAPVSRLDCVCGRVQGQLPASMTRAGAVLSFLLLTGCVTGSATAPAARPVSLAPPEEGCEPLGPMAVRFSTDLLMPEEALRASAVDELRRRAAVRGATHLVVARPSNPAMMAYRSAAIASGVAYRCPGQG